MSSVSVVIPVYKAELSMEKLFDQLMPAMEATTGQYEVTIVEDHGEDDPWRIISKLANQDTIVRTIRLSSNYGQYGAPQCSIRAARYETIVSMDDDLQNPVSEIRVLINKPTEGKSAPECRLGIHRHRVKAARCAYMYWKAPVRSFFNQVLSCNKSAIHHLHLADCFKVITECTQS